DNVSFGLPGNLCFFIVGNISQNNDECPGSPSLAVNKHYLEVLEASGALPPSVAYPGLPDGMS
ncbi:hypothetical protein ACQP3L_38885, partial [Escherichia coli]